jgi:hypothetical protein
MHEWERRRGERPAAREPVNRDAGSEHPLLALQRTAGNGAVADLVGRLSVQRFWPFDDEEEEDGIGPVDDQEEEEQKEEEDGGEEPDEDEEVDNSESYRNPIAYWTGSVGLHRVTTYGRPLDPADAEDQYLVGDSADLVRAVARATPYEPIPGGLTEGGSGFLEVILPIFEAPITRTDTRDLIARQAMRYVNGGPSPDIERIMNGTNGPEPGGGGAGPGGTHTPGGGAGPDGAGPGGGGPVGPGGGTGPGGGGIPGLEPVPGGGKAAGWPEPFIPGMEPVPGAGSPGMEPVVPGGGTAPGGTTNQRPMLRQGSVGDSVREMQELLVRHGAAIDPDGQFGSLTRRAVVDFQRGAGLDADGIVGKLTWGALNAG